MQSLSGEPFWLCEWAEVVFLHFEVNADLVQREVPFELDLFDGRAFVSLVAFTLSDMRPRIGGELARWLCRPFGTHRYLNARTYVRHRDQVGIYFLAEWLDAPWLNLIAGPLLYGLPFRCGQLDYHNSPIEGRVSGTVREQGRALSYRGMITGPLETADRCSLDEFLVERYRAFTHRHGHDSWFPVWHEPWRVAPLTAELTETSLLVATGEWSRTARLHSAHWSPGAGGVWMGWHQ